MPPDAQWQESVQPAQEPLQEASSGIASTRLSANRALCHEPAASVPNAPATHTINTTKAVCGEAASATTPPALNMTAAASWVGAIARNASWVESVTSARASDHAPNRADAAAAHMQSTPAIIMESQYEVVTEFA
ncbi:hypothetical protein NJB1604_28640 [Mycobacterium marinum]|nr:hypothetical protein NJB1604_28640 [Mycobacterium marinum]